MVAMADGPAMSGIASGTMKGSLDSGSRDLKFSPYWVGKIILIAIKNKIIPPEILRAGWVMFRPLRIFCPAKIKPVRIRNAIKVSRKIIAERLFASMGFKIDKNTGIFPKGSITKNKVIAVVYNVI